MFGCPTVRRDLPAIPLNLRSLANSISYEVCTYVFILHFVVLFILYGKNITNKIIDSINLL